RTVPGEVCRESFASRRPVGASKGLGEELRPRGATEHVGEPGDRPDQRVTRQSRCRKAGSDCGRNLRPAWPGGASRQLSYGHLPRRVSADSRIRGRHGGECAAQRGARTTGGGLCLCRLAAIVNEANVVVEAAFL